jgi:hypothetical protein
MSKCFQYSHYKKKPCDDLGTYVYIYIYTYISKFVYMYIYMYIFVCIVKNVIELHVCKRIFIMSECFQYSHYGKKPTADLGTYGYNYYILIYVCT